MKMIIYDWDKGLSDLDHELLALQKQLNNTGAMENAMMKGAQPILDEVKNQISMKAKYEHSSYNCANKKTGKKRTRGRLKRSLRAKFNIINYYEPVVDIGFTKKGAHSNILENSDKKVLRHIQPAIDLKEEKAKSIMVDELYRYL